MKAMIEVEIDDTVIVESLRNSIDLNWPFRKEPGMGVLHTSLLNVLSYHMEDREFKLYCNANKHYLKKEQTVEKTMKKERHKRAQERSELLRRGYDTGYNQGIKEALDEVAAGRIHPN